MWIPLRSAKMYSRIFGFQRRVWCPKWTPASSSCFMLVAAKRNLRFVPPLGVAVPWSTRVALTRAPLTRGIGRACVMGNARTCVARAAASIPAIRPMSAERPLGGRLRTAPPRTVPKSYPAAPEVP